jgi:hypothetical protein
MAIENLKKHLIFALSKNFIWRFGYTPNTLDFYTFKIFNITFLAIHLYT